MTLHTFGVQEEAEAQKSGLGPGIPGPRGTKVALRALARAGARSHEREGGRKMVLGFRVFFGCGGCREKRNCFQDVFSFCIS